MTEAYYKSIVALLRASDVDARAVSTGGSWGVQVALDVGGVIVWGNNGDAHRWAYTLIRDDGSQRVGLSEIGLDASPEVVAKMIATFDYDA